MRSLHSLTVSQDYIENSADMPKRKKTTPAPTVEITHISDSATQESQIVSAFDRSSTGVILTPP